MRSTENPAGKMCFHQWNTNVHFCKSVQRTQNEWTSALILKGVIFWDVLQYSPVEVIRRFGGSNCLRLQHRKYAKQQTRNKHTASYTLHMHRCGSLKIKKISVLFLKFKCNKNDNFLNYDASCKSVYFGKDDIRKTTVYLKAFEKG